MQLRRRKSIAGALKVAACTLLGASAPVAAQSPWQYDAAVLYYDESDNRVSAIEPVISARRDFGEDRILNLKLVIDSLTGATPNGALPSNQPQTFTTPSGGSSYSIAPGATPLDPTFKDTRVGLTAQWEQPLGRLLKGSFSANISSEYDFQSVGVSAAIARDFGQRNTTLSAGIAVEFDTIEPVGGVPIPFASMGVPGGIQPRHGADDTRTVTDLLFGLTQVISRRTLMQFNYSYGRSNGYLTDPYKLLSVIDPISNAVVDYLFENRPDSRTRQSLFWQTKYHLSRDVVDFSYRYLWDDWGIRSHTLDLHYRWQLQSRWYLQPRIRYYVQSEADFYVPGLVSGAPLPSSASADYRLADFDAWTIGLKYGRVLSKNREYGLRVDLYRQVGDDPFPDLDALIFQFGYSF